MCIYSSRGTPIGMNIMEELVKVHNEEVGRKASRRRRDVGSYSSEMGILNMMLNEFLGSIHIIFRASPTSPIVTVLCEGDTRG